MSILLPLRCLKKRSFLLQITKKKELQTEKESKQNITSNVGHLTGLATT
jgi:hypothetical protein